MPSTPSCWPGILDPKIPKSIPTGWPTPAHYLPSQSPRFGEVNYALEEFVAELKAQGTFDDVVIVTHSDFARTLTPNSNAGTDHGWSGIQMATKLTSGSRFLPLFQSFSYSPGIFLVFVFIF